ncbi:hypothetical protein BJ970_006401 [Saccharopolyspora phatthalungensis]|uniref:Uncharacterized protein n=1 Tax=Saccharopolyspora phatthalungensis TaxID=664693 RepID=A0A840Q8E8_9PSEU|nr:hypothetical protein [Saccharopolyspora phatthalungensis]
MSKDETSIPCNYGFDKKYGSFGVFGWYAGKDEIEIAFEAPSGKRTPLQSVITRESSTRRTNWTGGRSTSTTSWTSATGVVALLLQKEPTLDPVKVKSKLAYRPASDEKHDQNVWGAGPIDLDEM